MASAVRPSTHVKDMAEAAAAERYARARSEGIYKLPLEVLFMICEYVRSSEREEKGAERLAEDGKKLLQTTVYNKKSALVNFMRLSPNFLIAGQMVLYRNINLNWLANQGDQLYPNVDFKRLESQDNHSTFWFLHKRNSLVHFTRHAEINYDEAWEAGDATRTHAGMISSMFWLVRQLLEQESQLRSLTVDSRALTGMFSKFPDLQPQGKTSKHARPDPMHISLGRSALTKGLKVLSRCHKLKSLQLWNNARGTASRTQILCTAAIILFPKLETLEITGMELIVGGKEPSNSVQFLPDGHAGLRSLTLVDCKISQDSLRHLLPCVPRLKLFRYVAGSHVNKWYSLDSDISDWNQMATTTVLEVLLLFPVHAQLEEIWLVNNEYDLRERWDKDIRHRSPLHSLKRCTSLKKLTAMTWDVLGIPECSTKAIQAMVSTMQNLPDSLEEIHTLTEGWCWHQPIHRQEWAKGTEFLEDMKNWVHESPLHRPVPEILKHPNRELIFYMCVELFKIAKRTKRLRMVKVDLGHAWAVGGIGDREVRKQLRVIKPAFLTLDICGPDVPWLNDWRTLPEEQKRQEDDMADMIPKGPSNARVYVHTNHRPPQPIIRLNGL